MRQKYGLKLVSLNGEILVPAPLFNFNDHKGIPQLQYVLHGDPPVLLQADIFNPSLAALFKLRFVKSCAFITAGSSCHEPLTPSAAEDLQTALAKEFRKRSLCFSEGETKHSSGQRLSQMSFLVWGLSLEAAKVLGIKFGQNSILWCGLDAIPRLLAL